MNLRLMALKILRPVSKWVSKVHAPWTRKAVTGKHFFEALEFIKPGSVLVSYTNGELASLFIPGKWKHAAIYAEKFVGLSYVIEAKTSGVTITDLVTFMTTKDGVAILEPLFCDQSKMKSASDIAHRYIGKPYDFYFDPGDEAFYCSELIALSYESAIGQTVFEKRPRLGVHTVLPDDYVKAVKKWRIVWDSTRPSVDANIAGKLTS